MLGNFNSRGEKGYQINIYKKKKKRSAGFVSQFVIFILHRTAIEQSQQFDNSQVLPGCERAGLLLFVGGNSLHL